MTDVAVPHVPQRLPGTIACAGIPTTVAVGAVGGCALGIAARGWMRLISDDPEFSWSGTIFIVVGFTIFGVGQSIVAAARARITRRATLTVARVIGVVTMLPLFMAAGAVMLPTVLGGGLAAARTDWRVAGRIACLVVAFVPLMYVGRDLIHTFGWSFHALGGVTVMVAVYATVVWATQFALAPQRDGWRTSRAAKIAAVLGAAVLAALLVVSSVGLG